MTRRVERAKALLRRSDLRRVTDVCFTAGWTSPGSFKFARQNSKLAGTIRGSYFVIKGEY
jgi:transcriptional regulator GlxA family with amidase domain